MILETERLSFSVRNDLAEKDDAAELGYWLVFPIGDAGLCRKHRELLRHVFEDLKLVRVWCGYYDGNEKSKRMQEKLGFRMLKKEL